MENRPSGCHPKCCGLCDYPGRIRGGDSVYTGRGLCELLPYYPLRWVRGTCQTESEAGAAVQIGAASSNSRSLKVLYRGARGRLAPEQRMAATGPQSRCGELENRVSGRLTSHSEVGPHIVQPAGDSLLSSQSYLIPGDRTALLGPVRMSVLSWLRRPRHHSEPRDHERIRTASFRREISEDDNRYSPAATCCGASQSSAGLHQANSP